MTPVPTFGPEEIRSRRSPLGQMPMPEILSLPLTLVPMGCPPGRSWTPANPLAQRTPLRIMALLEGFRLLALC